MQRALIQYRNPKNHALVMEALIKGGREDLIGFDRKCLIRPRKDAHRNAERRNTEHRNAEHRNTKHQNAAKTSADGRRGDLKSGKKKTIRNVHRKKRKGLKGRRS